MLFYDGANSPEPTELEQRNRALSRRAAAEGIVLLKNDGVLPLTDKRVALYGAGARMTVKGGTGSGAVRERYSVNIETGLKDAGYEIATQSWLDRFDRYYADTYEAYRQEMEEKVAGIASFSQILRMIPPFQHPTGIPITAEDISGSACDTAIYVLARQAGEGNDRYDRPGDYYLDEVEWENLRAAAKSYRDLVVVVNVGGLIDLSFLDELSVSALVYVSQGGEEGGHALADVLSGKVNFSGKLADSWPVRFEDIPSSTTYSHLGGDPHEQEYTEGIYVGYRFFDSFGVKPRFPFGYGLSYTAFALSVLDVRLTEDLVQVQAEAVNMGTRSGREVLQLYASVPFGAQGAEYQRLAAFGKTGELAPSQREELTLSVPLRWLACYDEGRAAWVLRAGKYILRLGNSSANTVPAAVLTLARDAVVEQCVNVCPPQHEIRELLPPVRTAEDLPDVPILDITDHLPDMLTHSYQQPEEEIAAPVSAMTARQLCRLVVGGGTSAEHLQVTALGASGTTTPELYEELGIPNIILSDGPAGLNLTGRTVELPDGSLKAALVPENLEAYRRYLFGFSRTMLTKKMAAPKEGIEHYRYATAWPCSQLLAQSFDPALLEQVGDAVGAEMDAFGVTVWLAPGMNIHRNPLCGRTFEYYSEDPLLSGKLAAAIVRGVQSHPGKGMSVKHFAANNCELQRNQSSSNLTERALRELYLRGFEIAVRESRPRTVMAAYNKINGVYCTNNYDLLVKVLRCEWGFEGLVMSDWDAMKAAPGDCTKPLSGDIQKAHAAQCDLVMPGRPDQVEALLQGVGAGTVSERDLRRSAARVLKLIRENTAFKIRQ